MSYSEKYISSTYRFPAAALNSAAALGRIVGPKGKTGRLMGVAAVITTNVTTDPSGVRIGTGAAHSKYGTLSVPVATAGNAANDAVINPVDDNLIPADSVVLVATDGAAAAGAADLLVYIDWF